RYKWAEMPAFYQGLDVLVCPSRVEGGPMPVLEALSCGVRVVIPRKVGILDELPDTAGIHRYERGDAKGLVRALEAALAEPFDRKALRAVTEPYTVDAWCKAHAAMVPVLLGQGQVDAGITEEKRVSTRRRAQPVIKAVEPRKRGTGSTRGIYVVAFGGPARKSGRRLLLSIKKHMPDIPICLVGASKMGIEDVFIRQPDSDVGGRRAKLRAYELAPAEWTAVLYLDADTEVVAPIHRFFEWIEAGWEFVICKDPHLMDTMHAFERRNNRQELAQIQQEISTLHALQINGGVWAFQHDNPRVAAFFQRWRENWEEHAQRDQGALLRALYADPLKILWLGNEWNTFKKYCRGLTTAGLMHYPGDARRWKGMIPGRIDSPEAWAMVRKFEGKGK
ncbi:MAG TPA: glycosyltransferase, partial [Planctomycetota bacterium]|nr:glycosyltransferase [Planctomycetota bacterium]